MHDTEFTVVFLACITLALGALTRMAARRIKVPYTIAMLLLGLAVGFGLRRAAELGSSSALTETFARGADISPHLIIFVFVPALVFESAFALDLHAFRKNLGAVIVLAVPALLVATVGTGLAMVWITGASWQWSLSAALVFGALISATDPVAVVAILRETGAPKRLGVLIEGESLANDGTAIVVFSALIAVLTAGGWHHVSIGGELLGFAWVVSGGIAVGLGLGFAIGFVLGKSFNDPLLEITLTLALAYASMLVAEGLLHVSGVMAVVTAGLYMGGPGRTKISPEVHHFLHHFWETLAYIANTLIFFLVGLVVALQFEHMGVADVAIVGAAYLAIMALRFVVVFGFRPLLGVFDDPVTTREAAVMSWGGLRGAVSLALALVVSQDPSIAVDLREQILVTTAGVVLLTILVNGGTTGWALSRLGFTRVALSDRVAELAARARVLADVRDKVSDVSRTPDLRMVPWAEVTRDLEARHADLTGELARAQAELRDGSEAARAIGYWRQALGMERQAYWSAFAHGTLSGAAARMLDKEIDAHLDRLGRGDTRPPATRLPDRAGLLARLLGTRRARFDRLSTVYELSRAQTRAADAVLGHLDSLDGVDEATRTELAAAYRALAHSAKERLEDLRSNLPEIAHAIEARLARRIQLNFEREGYEHLAHHGALDDNTARAALDRVEREMRRLGAGALEVALPETADVCRDLPMFAGMDERALAELADITEELVLTPGEVLFRAGEVGDSMYIVVRGAVHVVVGDGDGENVVEVLGGGDILGEMALLTGERRTATIRAATTVTVGRIERSAFERLIGEHPAVRCGVLDAFTRSRFDNHLRGAAGFRHLDHDDRLGWLAAGESRDVAAGEVVPCAGEGYLFVATGEVEVDGTARSAPYLVRARPRIRITCTADARVAVLPRPEDVIAG